MYASSSLHGYDDDQHRRDLSDTEYVFGDGDDDDNLDITEDVSPAYILPGTLAPYYPGITTCIVCQQRPPYSKNGKSYPTCGTTCARLLEDAISDRNATPPRGTSNRRGRFSIARQAPQSGSTANASSSPSNLAQNRAAPRPVRPRPRPLGQCVVCQTKPCTDAKYVTCGLACAEKLCRQGAADKTMCDYCHRRPKLTGHNQCGKACADKAKVACLLCKSRPKFKRYHLCGNTCKSISVKVTPLILEAPRGHATYDLVERKFKSGWKVTDTPPAIRNVYKIVENKNFLQPYDRYKKSVGNEVFRYHGTGRKCTLGSNGNTQLCSNSQCALCGILRTSFKTSLANPSGGFGPGIYSSSAANKAYGFSGSSGAVLLTKVVLGKVRTVNGWNEVMSCPPGFNSVVFDYLNGQQNETIVYQDDAIRPVFLITF
ncbi:hypothetical protein NLJ89_g7599 [Agrocybe chaxingu]|uniref:PARP catalytic domain-containing protein n=1 Tax=Agrocybe chaxingu TaxID=84603 RepID=A0A9W8MSY7_9AGAR|nr:hypothetical protein NLJ89_g7599 [Agrocybe chaxingu]